MSLNSKNDCCWIVLATTGCSTDQATESLAAAKPSGDCCWIVIATTGCSTDAISAVDAVQVKNTVPDDCCWIVLATTGCSTTEVTKVQKGTLGAAQAANDCCWIILATTGCSTK
jgi:hypothetical protein